MKNSFDMWKLRIFKIPTFFGPLSGYHFLINAWYSNDLEKLELFRAENNSPTDVFYLFRLKDVEIFPEIV